MHQAGDPLQGICQLSSAQDILLGEIYMPDAQGCPIPLTISDFHPDTLPWSCSSWRACHMLPPPPPFPWIQDPGGKNVAFVSAALQPQESEQGLAPAKCSELFHLNCTEIIRRRKEQ